MQENQNNATSPSLKQYLGVFGYEGPSGFDLGELKCPENFVVVATTQAISPEDAAEQFRLYFRRQFFSMGAHSEVYMPSGSFQTLYRLVELQSDQKGIQIADWQIITKIPTKVGVGTTVTLACDNLVPELLPDENPMVRRDADGQPCNYQPVYAFPDLR